MPCPKCGDVMTRVDVRSLVSHRTLEPLVDLVLVFEDGREEPIGQWDMESAHHHLRSVMAAIEAAQTDAWLVAFLVESVGMDRDKAVAALAEFRAWREAHGPIDPSPPS